MKNAIQILESVLDEPKSSLDPAVWRDAPDGGKPTLSEEALTKLEKVLAWVQDQYTFSNLSVYIIGSICSNSWTESSDIDIDFCARGATHDDDDEDVVKEFGWAFKKNFIENYAEKNPEDSKIGSHPLEVYFSPTPFQCFMSVGCYNVLEKKWEVGPELKNEGFDPVSEYYKDAMKQVDKILKDIREKIFELYELAFVTKKSSDEAFKKEQITEICKKLGEVSELFKTMKRVRSNYKNAAKSREEALKRRKDKKQHVVDAAFKFLEKFGYIQILRDMIRIHDDIQSGYVVSDSVIIDTILTSVKDNMSLKHLQDSEDTRFAEMMQEAEHLDEGIRDLVKISAIAAMLAVPGLLPAKDVERELAYAKQVNQTLTLGSPETKKAIDNASVGNKMLGEMSKTNVVNAVAQVLWKEARGKAEGTAGRRAVASAIMNRSGNDPTNIIAVLKEPSAFTCLKGYTGGWTDKTYTYYVPAKAIAKNPDNKAIWDECNQIALELVDKKLKSTIGKLNSYLNKQTADKKNVETWGRQCQLKIGSHHFGYLREHDPKYVVPGTMVPWRKWNNRNKAVVIDVKSGDTLGKIAKANKTTVNKILKLNTSIKSPDSIYVGQKIRVK